MTSNKENLTSPISPFLRDVETTLLADDTIQSSLESLREKTLDQKILYFYVVDSEKKLVGILPTRKFLLGSPTQKIHEVMDKDFVTLNKKSTVENAMQLFVEHKVLALPTVDQEGQFLGVVDVYFCLEEAFDTNAAISKQEVFQMVGLSLEQRQNGSLWKAYKTRMPWLGFNIFAGLVCAMISDHFEEVLGTFLILAMFIPLVLTLSESVAMQSMSISLQAMHSSMGFQWKELFSRARKELFTALALGLTAGIFVGIAATFWHDGICPPIAIAGSIVASVCFSAIFGGVLPLMIKGFKLDPKVAAGPVALMIADIFTTLIYLGISSFWLLR